MAERPDEERREAKRSERERPEDVRPEAERLSKRVAALRGGSRREAEWLIEGGWVRVDGTVVEAPHSRVLDQAVVVDPAARLEPPVPVTLLWCAPSATDAGEPSTPTLANRSPDDRSGIRALLRHVTKLQEVLPLERGASGLVVFTQDDRIARRVTDARAPIEQEYVVECAQAIDDAALARLVALAHGESRGLALVRVSRQSERRMRFAVKGTRPGLVAALCVQAGLATVALRRLRVGRVPLAGLAPGQWRYLPPHHRF